MVFEFNLSQQVIEIMSQLQVKDKQLLFELNKKIKQIIASDNETINHYKNLRYGLSDYKRVHIGNSFVLLFSVNFKNNIINFIKFDHHDKIYKK